MARQVQQLDRETRFDIMKKFYVQLMCNASSTEFPSNAANSFKNRLPNPLQFRESGWKVGLTSLSYPTPPVRPHQTHTFKENDLICRFRWSMKSPDVRGNIIVNRWTLILTGKLSPKFLLAKIEKRKTSISRSGRTRQPAGLNE